MTAQGNRPLKWLVCALLAAAALAVFWPALHCAFLTVDDGDYVTENPNVQHGLNWSGIQWAFATGHAANWHPVTWMSHMVDCQLYDLDPMGHHLTSLLLHLANSVLLFLVLNRMTGALWRSAWVAAIFSLHPLRVESVVWVAERKDVLSTFFWMFSVWAFVRYAEEFKVQSSKFKVFYTLALVFFALALMAKPMVVTLPFVLLLLDYWPLRRMPLGAAELVKEKIPFFILSLASSVVTFLVQRHGGAVLSFTGVPMGARVGNVFVSYVRYLAKIFWPSGLTPLYPLPGYWPWGEVAASAGLLAAITAWVIWRARAQPYLAVGWFWFLGMLVPTIGLVQVGAQSMADRYSYLPSVGISLMVAWGLADLAARRPLLLKAAAAAGALTVAACAVLTPRQIAFWKNPIAFYARAAEFSDQDSLTCYNVGCAAMEQGSFPRAARCFERALKVADKSVSPSFLAQVQNNLGCALLEQGQITNAVAHFEQALKTQPRYPQAFYNMGRAFLTNGQPDVAADCFQRAAALDQNPAVLGALATAYAQEGNLSEAVTAAQRARALALAQNNRALALALEAQLRQYQAGGGGVRP